jgi:hypothetical protein
MRPPRFRLRTLLVAVAVAAVLMGGTNWALVVIDLRRTYLASARFHSQEAARYSRSSSELSRLFRDERTHPFTFDPLPGPHRKGESAARGDVIAAYHAAYAAYHAALRRKYERAAARPFLPVAPDPPPP